MAVIKTTGPETDWEDRELEGPWISPDASPFGPSQQERDQRFNNLVTDARLEAEVRREEERDAWPENEVDKASKGTRTEWEVWRDSRD
jgi:hypothetical protein